MPVLLWLRRRRTALLVLLALALRFDLLGTPFVEYFSNREVQNAIPIRMMQEGLGFWQLPNAWTDTYGIAEFQLLPLMVRAGYGLLESVGVAQRPQAGDAAAAARYYLQVATLGRLWSLLMAAVAMVGLRRLLATGWSVDVADLALLFYAVSPFNRFYDQLFIVEPTIMALSILALLQLRVWSERPQGGWARFAAAAAAVSLVLLLKISHVFIGLPVAWLMVRRWGLRAALRWPLWAFGAVALLPAVFFYKVGFGGSVEGLDSLAWDNTKAMVSNWAYVSEMALKFMERHAWTIWTPLGSGLLLGGMSVACRHRDEPQRSLSRLLLVWSAAWIYYWFMGGPMSGHYYYQAPSVPLAVAFMALAAETAAARWRPGVRRLAIVACVVTFLVFGEVVQRVNDEDSRFWRGGWCQTILTAGLKADRRLPPHAQIVAGCRGAVQFMLFYYVHRGGWGLRVEDSDLPQADAPARLEELREQGAGFYVAAFGYDGPRYNGVVFDRAVFDELPIARYLREHYTLLEQDDVHLIYDLGSRNAAPLR